MHIRLIVSLGACAALSVSAAAQDASETPEAVVKLYECQSVSDTSARLACYDAQVTQMRQLESQAQLRIMDAGQIETERRSRFGFAPQTSDQQAIKELDSTIVDSVKLNTKWAFELEDGSRWLQTDTANFIRRIPAGTSVKISRTAMSGYKASIDERRAIRVKRVN